MRSYTSFLSFFLVACLCLLPQVATGDPLSVPVDHLTSFTGHLDGSGSSAATVAQLAMAGAAVPKGTFAKMKAAIKQKLGLGDDRDADVDALLADALEEIEVTPTPQPPVTTGNPLELATAIQQALAPLQAELKQVQDALASEATQRRTAQEALQAQQAREREASITTALDEAQKAGKFAPAKRDEWKARLEKDFDGVSAILADVPGNPALAKGQTAAKPDATSQDSPVAPKPEPGTMAASLTPDVLSYVAGAA